MLECIDSDLEVNHVVIARASTPKRFSLNEGKKCLGQDSVSVNCVTTARASMPERISVATEMEITDPVQYDEHHHKIIQFLQTIQVPIDIFVGKDCHVRIEATEYHVVDGVLFRRNTKGRMSRKVICHENDKKAILKALHEESGHRGRDGTAKRYSGGTGGGMCIKTQKNMSNPVTNINAASMFVWRNYFTLISRPQCGTESVSMSSTCRKVWEATNISLWPEKMCQDGWKQELFGRPTRKLWPSSWKKMSLRGIVVPQCSWWTEGQKTKDSSMNCLPGCVWKNIL